MFDKGKIFSQSGDKIKKYASEKYNIPEDDIFIGMDKSKEEQSLGKWYIMLIRKSTNQTFDTFFADKLNQIL